MRTRSPRTTPAGDERTAVFHSDFWLEEGAAFAHPHTTAAAQAPPNDAPTLSARPPSSESSVKTLTSDQKPRFLFHPLNTGSSFTSIGTYEPSPSQTMLAYTVDKKGFETYDIVVQPIGGAPVEEIKEVDSSLCWGKDDKHLYYLKFDEQHRPYQVWRHTVGGSTDDEMLYQVLVLVGNQKFDASNPRESKISRVTSTISPPLFKSGD